VTGCIFKIFFLSVWWCS